MFVPTRSIKLRRRFRSISIKTIFPLLWCLSFHFCFIFSQIRINSIHNFFLVFSLVYYSYFYFYYCYKFYRWTRYFFFFDKPTPDVFDQKRSKAMRNVNRKTTSRDATSLHFCLFGIRFLINNDGSMIWKRKEKLCSIFGELEIESTILSSNEFILQIRLVETVTMWRIEKIQYFETYSRSSIDNCTAWLKKNQAVSMLGFSTASKTGFASPFCY